MEEIVIFDIEQELEFNTIKTKRDEEIDNLVIAGVLTLQQKYNLKNLSNLIEPDRSRVSNIQLISLLRWLHPIVGEGYSIPVQLSYTITALPLESIKNLSTRVYTAGEIIPVVGLYIGEYLHQTSSYTRGIDRHIFDELHADGSLLDYQVFPRAISPVNNINLFTKDTESRQVIAELSDFIDMYRGHISRVHKTQPTLSPSTYAESSKLLTRSTSGELLTRSTSGKLLTRSTSGKLLTRSTSGELLDETDSSYKIDEKLLAMMTAITTKPYDNMDTHQIIGLLDNAGLLQLTHIAEKLGIDSDEFAIPYTRLLENKNNAQIISLELRNYYDYFNKLAKVESLAQSRFSKSFDALNDKERRIIEKASIVSKEPIDENLAKLVRDLKRTYEINDNETELSRLLAAIDNSTGSKKDILLASGDCPHTIDYIRYTLEYAKSPDKNNIIRERMMKDYWDVIDGVDYYCRVCGGYTYSENTAISFGEGMSNVDDPLQSSIWKETMYIVNTNVRFVEPIPIKPFVSSIAAGLRDVLHTEKIKLSRSKTMTTQLLQGLMSIKVTVYIYAALAAVMLVNGDKLHFGREARSDRGARVRGGKTRDAQVMRDLRSGLIKRMSGGGDTKLTPHEYVVELMVGGGGDSGATDRQVARDLRSGGDDTVELMISGGGGAGDRSIKSGNLDTYDSTVELMVSGGGDVDDKQVIKDLRGGDLRVGGGDLRGGNMDNQKNLKTALVLVLISKEPIINSIPTMTKEIVTGMFSEAYKWCIKHIRPMTRGADVSERHITIDNITANPFFTYMHHRMKMTSKPRTLQAYFGPKIKDYIKGGKNIYQDIELPNIKDIMDNYSELSWYTIAVQFKNEFIKEAGVPPSVKRLEYVDIFQALKKLDTIAIARFARARQVMQRKVITDDDMAYNTSLHNFYDMEDNRAKFFCNTGSLHKVETYIYSNRGKEVEYSKKDIISWIKEKKTDRLEEFAELQLVDERCSLCQVRIRSVKLDNKFEKELDKTFIRLRLIEAFYTYYELRCPEGDLHDIEKETCKKCKFTDTKAKSRDVSYFDKYIEQYRKERKKQIESDFSNITGDNAVREIRKIKPVEWQYSLTNVNELSKVSDIKYNVLVNIGLTEGLRWSDLEEGAVDPSKEPYSYTTRCMNILTHITDIIKLYNQVVTELINMPRIIQELVSTPLPKNIPEFTIVNEYAAYAFYLSPEDYTNYLLQYLCGMLISIHAVDQLKPLGKYFITYVIGQEKLLSKALPYISKDKLGNESSGSENAVVGESSQEPGYSSIDEAESGDIQFDNNFDVENIEEIGEKE